MKKTKIFFLLLGLTIGLPKSAFAQEEISKAAVTTASDTVVTVVNSLPKDVVTSTSNTTVVANSETKTLQLPTDSLDTVLSPSLVLPSPDRSLLMYGITPFMTGSYANWELHKGFNASLGMSISIGVGHNRLPGVGFGQDAAFLYAVPLNNRLSVAGGVYATNMDWGNYSYRNVGVTGIAAFKATDRITIYGYGNKSLMSRRLAPIYPLPNFNPDCIGGMVNFKVNDSFSFGIGVQAQKNDVYYGYLW